MIHNKYWVFEKAIPKEQCEKIIELGLNNLEDATVGGELERHNNPEKVPAGTLTTKEIKEKKLDTYIRDSKIAWLSEPWIYEMISNFVNEANVNAGWKFDLSQHETPQFTKYTGGGFYSWHQDGLGDHISAYKPYVHGITDTKLRKDGGLPSDYTPHHQHYFLVRKLSMTINLTDPTTYEGGDLMFDLGEHHAENKITAKEAREQGTVIVFPSFLYHCVSPVTKGTRYSLVNWTTGRPFK